MKDDVMKYVDNKVALIGTGTVGIAHRTTYSPRAPSAWHAPKPHLTRNKGRPHGDRWGRPKSSG